MDGDLFRLLDVNVNRAREALRVVEDYARFVLDDSEAAAAVKRCRHDLRQIVGMLDGAALLAARDIEGDVDRALKTPGELTRTTLSEVVGAAFGRLSEAARGLGEYGKLVSGPAAAAAETLRYAVYELEQRIMLRGGLRARFRAVRLYVLLTEQLCRRPWLSTAEAVLRGGATCVQLREKDLADAELLHRARQLRELTRTHQALLAVNDRPDIARLAGADIVHVGQDDLGVADVRRTTGTERLVGKSTHTPAQVAAAVQEQPDYLAVGPMFPSGTKPQAHIAGPQTLAAARGMTGLPLVAIGGVTAQNAPQLAAAGADCVCVCAAVIQAEDPEAAACAIVDAFTTVDAGPRPVY